jgi:hypothetical protein
MTAIVFCRVGITTDTIKTTTPLMPMLSRSFKTCHWKVRYATTPVETKESGHVLAKSCKHAFRSSTVRFRISATHVPIGTEFLRAGAIVSMLALHYPLFHLMWMQKGVAHRSPARRDSNGHVASARRAVAACKPGAASVDVDYFHCLILL